MRFSNKLVIIFIFSFFLISCSTQNQQQENKTQYESKPANEIGAPDIVFGDRITDDGYYNGPIIYTQEQEGYDRRKDNWNQKIDKFYLENE